MVCIWCGVQKRIMSSSLDQRKNHNQQERIKFCFQCHFIIWRLQLRTDDVGIIYTTCRHIDKYNVSYHGKYAIGRPMRFNYGPHLTRHMWSSVQHFIQRCFSVLMIWDKFISDIKDGSSELYTGIYSDTYMTRQYILNIHNDTIRLEYFKNLSDPNNV